MTMSVVNVTLVLMDSVETLAVVELVPNVTLLDINQHAVVLKDMKEIQIFSVKPLVVDQTLSVTLIRPVLMDNA